jgi:trans-aconitate methyltransferase
LSDEYLRQYRWRPWRQIYAALPDLTGQTVFDIGCGVGDQAADLAARGAKVVGLDRNEELINVARSRHVAGVDFVCVDIRDFQVTTEADGIWSSFSAAYFSDLANALKSWRRHLKAGGWIAVTEIDDLFGHEPLGARPKSLLAAYAAEAFRLGRYDFYAGRKLQPLLVNIANWIFGPVDALQIFLHGW